MAVIDVNTEGLIKFSKKLDKIGNKSVPIAVRQTLNSVAFDAKKVIPEEASKMFVIRNKGFYRRFSKVQMAEGLRINSMKSKVGIVADNNEAAENQTQQQITGTIGRRTFVPLDESRTGGDNKRLVKKENRLSELELDNVYDTKYSGGSNPKKRFIQTAIMAVKRFGGEGYVMHRGQKGKKILYRIRRGANDINTTEGNLEVTPLYSVKRGRSVSIKQAKPFTRRAGLRVQKNASKHYIRHAKRQLSRIR